MSRPRLKLGSHLLPGVVALALFGVLAVMFVGAPIGQAEGLTVGTLNETNLTATAPAGVDVPNASVESRSVGNQTVLYLTEQRNGNATEVYNATIANRPGAKVNREVRENGIYAVASTGGVTQNIGYAMFALGDLQPIPGEAFLVAFEIIDVVLVAALVAAVMLARRDAGGTVKTALGGEDEETATDGGRDGGDR